MFIPISGVGAFIDFLVLFYFFLKIRNRKDSDNTFVLYFTRYTLVFSLFYLFFSLPILLVPNNSSAIGWGYLIGHIFAYIGFGYLARIFWLVTKPTMDSSKIFIGYLIAGAILTLANIYYFNYPEVLSNGITNWNQNTVVGASIIILGMTVFLPTAITFIREGIRNRSNRKKYLFLGTAFALIIIGGPLHDVAKTPGMSLLADFVTTSGFISMFIGLIVDSKNKEKKETGNVQSATN